MSEFIMKASTDEQAEFCRRYSNMQELVRCENCKYGSLWSDEQVIVCDKLSKTRNKNWFCADGVRKDERIYHQS